MTAPAHPPAATAKTVAPLIHALSGHDALPPWTARRALEALGPTAVPSLIEGLDSPDAGARWEAAKALSTIADAASTSALVTALEHEDPSVRWLAAEGLARIGPAALQPLLRALVHSGSSAWLREGAHHALRASMTDALAPLIQPVVRAIERPEPAIATMAAASRALRDLEAAPARPTAGASWQWHATRLPVVQRAHGAWRHLAMRI